MWSSVKVRRAAVNGLGVLAMIVGSVVTVVPAMAQEKPAQEQGAGEGQAGQAGQEGRPGARRGRQMSPEMMERMRNRRAQGQGGEGAGVRQKADPAEIVPHMWWHDPEMITALSLSEAQRLNMDRAVKLFLGGSEERQEAIKKNREAFYAALETSDLEAAEKVLPQLQAAEGEPTRAIAAFKLEVFAAMTPNQRTKAFRDHDTLMKQSWVRTAMMKARGKDRKMAGQKGPAAKGNPSAKGKQQQQQDDGGR